MMVRDYRVRLQKRTRWRQHVLFSPSSFRTDQHQEIGKRDKDSRWTLADRKRSAPREACEVEKTGTPANEGTWSPTA